MNWYKKAMALDPEAYKTEPSPARLQQHQDISYGFNPYTGKTISIPQIQDQNQIDAMYSGVHFAFTPEHAALYACGKATKDDPPVIIEIEPKGLRQQPDVDAMLDQSLTYYIDEKRSDWSSMLQSGEDIETIADNLHEDIDDDVQNWTIEGDINDTADDIVMQQQIPIPPYVIRELIVKKSPQRIVNIIGQLVDGSISNKLLIKIVGQMRVNNSIDSSRVKAIYQVPWIDLSAQATDDIYSMDEEQLEDFLEEKGWHMENEDVINENGQIVPSYESLLYNQWLSLTPLYTNKQMYFKGYTSKDSVWHGTTLSRAKNAYPDLLNSISLTATIYSWHKTCQSQTEPNLQIKKEPLSDRCRVYLMDDVKEVGKLTLQIYLGEKYYYLTAFKIAPQYRDKGWGSKMLREILNDPKYQDKPILVQPAPYGGDIGSYQYNQEIDGLEAMYKKFSFDYYDAGYMIRYPSSMLKSQEIEPEHSKEPPIESKKTESWYKPPFMRAMNYIGAP